ncbi:MAG: hypothetical protein FD127_4460 [Acidimicrobiaceae bacterium]|nr:MAG: hypothetical protein FD127_4460 [Acidimicrobiaceae bacterium]
MRSPSSTMPLQSSSRPSHASGRTGLIEQSPHTPLSHVRVPDEHSPGSMQVVLAAPVHVHPPIGLFGVPSQSSSSIAGSHASTAPGCTSRRASSQSSPVSAWPAGRKHAVVVAPPTAP